MHSRRAHPAAAAAEAFRLLKEVLERLRSGPGRLRVSTDVAAQMIMSSNRRSDLAAVTASRRPTTDPDLSRRRPGRVMPLVLASRRRRAGRPTTATGQVETGRLAAGLAGRSAGPGRPAQLG